MTGAPTERDLAVGHALPPPPGGLDWSLPPMPARPRPTPLRDRSPRRLLVLVAVGGIVLEVGLRGGAANVLVTLAVAVLVAGLVTGERLERRSSKVLALTSLLPAGFLAVRASSWLAASNIAVVAGLIAAAVLFDRRGRRSDMSLGDVLRRLLTAVPLAVRAPTVLAPLVPRGARWTSRARAIGRAALIAVPVLGVVVALLASADAVFARIVVPDVNLGGATGHVVAALTAAWLLLAVAVAPQAPRSRARPFGTFGVIEVLTMLGLAAAVLGVFVVSQLVGLTATGHRLLASSGTTPADHARHGFFQLCWATAILLGFLGLVDRLSDPGVRAWRSVRILGAVVPLLAVGLVVVSLQRMARYDEAFGLTMLRLWVIGATIWLGIVLALTAARSMGIGASRRWVLAGAALAAVALVLVADVADPEAYVVRHDVARAAQGAPLDGSYLAGLSADAVPTLVRARSDATDTDVQAELDRALRCTGRPNGVTRLNLAEHRASDRRGEVDRCAEAGRSPR